MGKLPRRGGRTTLEGVAKAVGVHPSTVSRALDPNTPPNKLPRKTPEIRAAADRLNYRPDARARGMRTGTSRIIGVVIPDLDNPVFGRMYRGIESVLHEHDYLAILAHSAARGQRHATAMSMLQEQSLDGFIIGSVRRNDTVLRQLAQDGTALVTLNRRSEDVSISSVTNDESEGIRAVLEHLKSLGHTRVLNIAGPQATSTGLARYQAFEQHRKALGLDTAEELVVFAEQYNEADGERCTMAALDRLRGVTAIAAANDRLAIGVLNALRMRGIACPAQMSVTGFNDMSMMELIAPALTTVQVQQFEVGRRAAQILMQRIKKGPSALVEHVVMPVKLIVRASTAVCPAGAAARRRGRAVSRD